MSATFSPGSSFGGGRTCPTKEHSVSLHAVVANCPVVRYPFRQHRTAEMVVDSISASFDLINGAWRLSSISVQGLHIKADGEVGTARGYMAFGFWQRPLTAAPAEFLAWAQSVNPGRFGAAEVAG